MGQSVAATATTLHRQACLQYQHHLAEHHLAFPRPWSNPKTTTSQVPITPILIPSSSHTCHNNKDGVAPSQALMVAAEVSTEAVPWLTVEQKSRRLCR